MLLKRRKRMRERRKMMRERKRKILVGATESLAALAMDREGARMEEVQVSLVNLTLTLTLTLIGWRRFK